MNKTPKPFQFTYSKEGKEFTIHATVLRNDVPFASNKKDDALPIEVELKKVIVEENLDGFSHSKVFIDILPYLEVLNATDDIFGAAYKEAHNHY